MSKGKLQGTVKPLPHVNTKMPKLPLPTKLWTHSGFKAKRAETPLLTLGQPVNWESLKLHVF